MEMHFDILIDASGSMGYMKGAGNEHENKYLLPDGSTRTDLVKKILLNSIVPKLSFVDSLTFSTFRNEYEFDKEGKRIIIDKKYKDYPATKLIYSGNYDSKRINSLVSEINNPDTGGTPLFWAIKSTIDQKVNLNIIILSDGGANDNPQFDEEVLKLIRYSNKKCKIYFIGIDQDDDAQKKSKNLADKTGGFYVNLEVINYDEAVFNNMLFEFNTKITSNALKESLKIEPTIVEPTSETLENKIESNFIEKVKEDITIEEKVIQKDIEPLDLKKQVEDNTKSLQLITSQLDSIVKQISFIGREKSDEKDEFVANEDEEKNKLIGDKSEKLLFDFLKLKWENTNWLNENGEQGKPYDFEIIIDSVTYFIECKGSTSNSKEFFLTKNEWLFYLANRKNYRLYFVSEINSSNPTIHRIEDLLNAMEEGKLIPCSSVNKKVKADRILFQISK